MGRQAVVAGLCLALLMPMVPSRAGAGDGPPGPWSPPVDGAVVRGFEPPASRFGPRHLGVDYAAAPGTPVRAAGDGVVDFAGRVGRSWAVAISHAGRRRTSYAYLLRPTVRRGSSVARGDVLGVSGGTGPGHGPVVVHFGLRVAGAPRDPASLFPAPTPAPVSLAPLWGPAPEPVVCPAGRPPGRENPGSVRLH